MQHTLTYDAARFYYGIYLFYTNVHSAAKGLITIRTVYERNKTIWL